MLIAIILYKIILFLTSSVLKKSYYYLFAREWTVNIMALIVIPVFVYLSLNGYKPSYLDNTLKQTLINATSLVGSNCAIINDLLKWMKELDAGLWWLVDSSASNVKPIWLKAIIWFSFIIYNSLVLLGINRLIVHIIYLVDKILKGNNSDK